jgi:Sec-independent protein translocase protein TatA
LAWAPLEVMIILVVAFIVLGPQRMMDAAKLLGKATREVRRMSQGLTEALDETMEEPRVHRPGGHTSRDEKGGTGTGDAQSTSPPPAAGESGSSPSQGGREERRES